MLTLIFVVMMVTVFGKMTMFGLRAAWGITRMLASLVFLPLMLIGMVAWGLIHLAIPVLVILAVISVFGHRRIGGVM